MLENLALRLGMKSRVRFGSVLEQIPGDIDDILDFWKTYLWSLKCSFRVDLRAWGLDIRRNLKGIFVHILKLSV